MRCRITDAPARERRAASPEVSLLLGSERLVGQRIGRDGRARVLGVEVGDDEHHAVHADPVAGKGADVEYSPGSFGAANPRRSVSPSLSSLVA